MVLYIKKQNEYYPEKWGFKVLKNRAIDCTAFVFELKEW